MSQRISWSPAEVAAEQRRALRALLGVASARSVWHRERLAGIDLDNVAVEDIETLPVMTKSDLMDNFDDIVTDRRLGRAVCENHLERSRRRRVSLRRVPRRRLGWLERSTRHVRLRLGGVGDLLLVRRSLPGAGLVQRSGAGRRSPRGRGRGRGQATHLSGGSRPNLLGNRNDASLPARDAAARGHRRRTERGATDDSAGLQLGAPSPRAGGTPRTAAHPAPPDQPDLRAARAGDEGAPGRGLGRSRHQRLRHVRRPVRQRMCPRHPPAGRPVPGRDRRPRRTSRAAGPAGSAHPRHQPLQPRPPVDPLRGHRRSAASSPGRARAVRCFDGSAIRKAASTTRSPIPTARPFIPTSSETCSASIRRWSSIRYARPSRRRHRDRDRRTDRRGRLGRAASRLPCDTSAWRNPSSPLTSSPE